MEDKVPLSIIYLGRRGGGAKITKNISEDLQTSNIFSLMTICVRKDNELIKEYDQSRVATLFDNLTSLRTLSKVIQYALFPTKLLSDTGLSMTGVCLVPMISPLGLIIEGLLRAQGVTVIRLLHDFEKHPGDTWPPSFLIRRIVKNSKFLITLSTEVASKVKELNPNIGLSIYPHPAFDFSTSRTLESTSKKYILFVGRIRKYKGIENLVAAFFSLDQKDTELVIAGEGKSQIKPDPRIRFINRWLEEYEIASLVQNAEVVVFPYIEASQSGILPYCISQKKKVVVTPLPGLLEQTVGYENSFATRNFDIDSLSYALKAAIGSETFSSKTKTRTTKIIETCLLESGFFTKK
jgi:glycosyltransferase involved in cell wall biosynthesis